MHCEGGCVTSLLSEVCCWEFVVVDDDDDDDDDMDDRDSGQWLHKGPRSKGSRGFPEIKAPG